MCNYLYYLTEQRDYGLRTPKIIVWVKNRPEFCPCDDRINSHFILSQNLGTNLLLLALSLDGIRRDRTDRKGLAFLRLAWAANRVARGDGREPDVNPERICDKRILETVVIPQLSFVLCRSLAEKPYFLSPFPSSAALFAGRHRVFSPVP